MKLNEILTLRLAVLMMPVSLSACQEQLPVVAGGGAVKSQAYYAAHLDEATPLAKICKAFLADGYTAMGPSKQAAWLETTDGINCKNAIGAYGLEVMNARARRMQEADARSLQAAEARIKQTRP